MVKICEPATPQQVTRHRTMKGRRSISTTGKTSFFFATSSRGLRSPVYIRLLREELRTVSGQMANEGGLQGGGEERNRDGGSWPGCAL